MEDLHSRTVNSYNQRREYRRISFQNSEILIGEKDEQLHYVSMRPAIEETCAMVYPA